MPATPYPELNEVLRELVDSAQAILADSFIAACLQGSFAVGDFDRHSDVDFVIVTKEEPSAEQLPALQAMHERVFNLDSRWAQHLEGSYFPEAVLRHYTQRGGQLWYLDNGARTLIKSDHCNTIVVRWVVREAGVALAGPAPASLVDPIPAAELRKEILSTINKWGQEILADPESINNRFYQSFAVLSYCRMLHDLQAGTVSSKRTGAAWAKDNLDPAWAGLIDRSWHGRPNPAISVRQPADPDELRQTLAFVQTVIEAGNRFAEKYLF